MYKNNQRLIELMHKKTVMPIIRGSIDNRLFTTSDVIQNSFSATNQCVGGNDIKIGSVVIGDVSLTLSKWYAINRGDWRGKTLYLDVGLSDGFENQLIDFGVYTISSAVWQADGLHIIAYDNMSKLDKEFFNNLKSGTAYEWMNYICNSCDVNNGMSAEEMAQLPNGTEQLSFKSLDNVQTFRDALHWLAVTLGGFATCNRYGAIEIRRFRTEIDDVIDWHHRYSGSQFADFTTYYTGISFIDTDDTTDYIHVTPDNGLTMNLGENPLVQFGTKDVQAKMRKAVLDSVVEFRSVPFTVRTLFAPAYELGDRIRFTSGVAGAQSDGYIMAYELKLNECTFTAYGTDPALQNGRSKADKDISGLRKKVKAEQLAIHDFYNRELVELDSSWQRIGGSGFAVPSDQTVLFHAVAKMKLNKGGLVRFMYVFNGENLPFVHEVQMTETVDTATLFIPLNAKGNTPQDFNVYVQSDNAIGYIEALDMNAALIAYGLTTTDWTGRFDLDDTMPLLGLGSYSVLRMADDFRLNVESPISRIFDVTMPLLALGSYTVEEMIESVSITSDMGVFTRFDESGVERRLEGTNIIRKTKGGFITDGTE